ncbi:MAG TPA: glycosyltransferase family 1 protein [Chloroflexota bacterium]|nr:glycosyltransferase family 1 protein [Chloroflexota bacterium]
MRIGIDVRYLSHGLVGGVHTYVRRAVPALIAAATDQQIYLYADTKRSLELQNLPGHVTVRYLPWKNPLSSIVNDFVLWRRMALDHLDVAHFPANYGFGPPDARTVITLHDELNLLPLREIFQGLHHGNARNPRSAAMFTYLHYCTTRALRRADLVLTVSEYSRREIARRGGYDRQRIVAIPSAPALGLKRIEDRSVTEEVRNRYGLRERFVLGDALKNPDTLVAAWRRLPIELRTERQIVFFSRRPDPRPIVHEAVASGDARLLIRPSDQDLAALYSSAEAFVFPSLFEGFGLPLIEAMICGAPVIASTRGSIPEVVGDAALLADATDVAGFAAHLRALFEDRALAGCLRERGFARAAPFTWERAAGRILASYEHAVQTTRVTSPPA